MQQLPTVQTYLWIVVAIRVQLLPDRLIHHEICTLERDVHCQLRGVAAVEGHDSFRPQHTANALQGTTVWAVVHL